MRAPNEIDFWRGLALITIFIDHIPGIFYEHYTYRHIGLSDAAEVFVFLAGWSLRLVMQGAGKRRQSPLRTFLRLESRAFAIYVAQVFIISCAVALTAFGALYFADPLLLELNNASAIFGIPIEAQLGVFMLSHQLGFFDILPLYVVLMATAPLIVLLDWLSGWLLLGLSLAVYSLALWRGINIPTWPVEGHWFLNPLAWQLVFVLGFLVAKPDGIAAFAHQRPGAMRWIALPVIVVSYFLAQARWTPNPLLLPEPRLFFMFDKTFASPARILHLLCAVTLVAGLFPPLHRWLGPLTRFSSLLGRNSLNVFCAASVLSLGGQFIRYASGNSIATDTLVVLFGVMILGGVAWLSEWSERIQ